MTQPSAGIRRAVAGDLDGMLRTTLQLRMTPNGLGSCGAA
jgi:hypothetical protein